MTGLTYQGKPARLDVHLPDGYPPVGFMHQEWPALIPRMAWALEEPDYYVVSLNTAIQLAPVTAKRCGEGQCAQ